MIAQDILLDEEFDLAISDSGDFYVEASDMQHIILIIETYTGSWKQFPFIGVGIMRYSGSPGDGAKLRREINVNLTADKYSKVNVVLKQLTDGTFIYDVDAKRNG